MRYGPESERLVQEALKRETWTAGQWASYHQEKLPSLLRRAAADIPFYRRYWRNRRDADTISELVSWPVLEKEQLRENPLEFVADECHVRKMLNEHTSGTTGKPLNLWLSREAVRAYYALYEARCRRWHGVSRHDPWAMAAGQLIVPVSQTRPHSGSGTVP